MSLYTLGDPHLSGGVQKPMDVFGGVWRDYQSKLKDSLAELLTDDDLLVIAGDFSWGMTLEQALPEFLFLDAFPGRKVLLKGNHDYWWETVSKMQRFFQKNTINSLQFLHNNCIFYKGVVACGTRGWFYDPNDPSAGDDKVFRREVIRLEASLKAACTEWPDSEIFCFLHYPPVFGDAEVPEITGLLQHYGVSRCYYGHLHGESCRSAFCGTRGGVEYRLVSADFLNFRPLKILE